jgi:hypothetical protein
MVDRLIGILGLIVGIVGIWLAFRSDRKMKTAQEARRRVEKKLLRHMVVRNLDSLKHSTLVTMGKIKEREWADVAESAENLGQQVVEVRAAWIQLLEPLERDKLDAAALNIQQFIDSAPTATPQTQPSEDDVQLMLVRCRRLAEIASEVAGRLGVELMQDTED